MLNIIYLIDTSYVKTIVTACMLTLLSFSQAAAQDARPDTGFLHGSGFRPAYDAVCGLGSAMGDGCAAIRARDIVDAEGWPWRAIGRVNFAGIRTRQHCTGTLVAPRVVLTAAHCLYSYPRRMWIQPHSITFVAGYQRGGGVAVSRGRRFVLDAGQDTASRDFRATPDTDWALVILEDPIGHEVGFLDLVIQVPAGAGFMLAGYAGLRPEVLSVARECGTPLAGVPAAVMLRCAAMQGDSGAPVLVRQGGSYAVAAVFSSVMTRGEDVFSLAIAPSAFRDAVSQVRRK